LLRYEVASLQELNETYAGVENPKAFAIRAHQSRRRRLKEIMQELALMSKERNS
jgi:hypothetical protein